MKHLGLIGAVLLIILLTAGMIGWVLTVVDLATSVTANRNDVTGAVQQITAAQEDIAAIHERMENERTLRTDLHTDQAGDLVTITNGLSDRLSGLETDLALLRELGEIGVLPSGERRDYVGHGNR